ncbi:hypothetical protein [Celeribacter neptunius]|uniref:Uncharacterized protein n=1 Tax=Celeribacter neptunius TaxID=588602 RepID=A0A1I3QPL0_9RHOB|nr:hypothetical protein [Celeribacter neptunius]SFJ35825.1 hypothetical protein SAMN04487991_1913 [Celeribacter neptunius]
MTETQTAPGHPNTPTWVNLHIGVHFTANGYLPENVQENEERLKANGIYTPTMRHARAVILSMLEQLDGLPPIKPEEEEVMMRLLGQPSAGKLFLSDDRWSASLRDSFSGDMLYSEIAERVAPVTELFASSDLQISLSLINPAVFLYNSLTSGTAQSRIQGFLERVDPETLRWRDTIAALRSAVPDVPLLIWCEEDAPLIWPRVLHKLFNLSGDQPLTGALAPLRPLLEDEGFIRLDAYLRSHPPETQAQYEQVILLFLDKYGRPDVLAPRCDIPGWDDIDIEAVSAHYEEDIAELAQSEGITFLLPGTQAE